MSSVSAAGVSYISASQAVHSVPAVSVTYPAIQIQSVILLLPVTDFVPMGHVEHACVPVTDLYVPTAQATHSILSKTEVLPGVHTQSKILSLPGGELVPLGQSEHSTAPTRCLYFPA